ncbi:MAG: hypothetical protein J6X30_03645 [Clostridia bacterium]|nr:hypothetical protein [Clostridia bacterium]
MKFSQMPYQRPDAAELKKEIARLTRALRAAESFDAANEVFLEEQKWQKHVRTLDVLAHIRHSIISRTPSRKSISSDCSSTSRKYCFELPFIRITLTVVGLFSLKNLQSLCPRTPICPIKTSFILIPL